MFPFFRKAKAPERPAEKREVRARPAPVAEDVRLTTLSEFGPDTLSHAEPSAAANPKPKKAEPQAPAGIQVQEMAPTHMPEVEEAVVLYANGRTDDAAAALNRCILEHSGSRHEQPWQLLFDLYEATGQRQKFEELALDFAMRLERSPPTWRKCQPEEKRKASAKNSVFVFATNLAAHDAPGLEAFREECGNAESVSLDFGKILSPSDDYSALLLDILKDVEKRAKDIRLSGGDAFIVRLDASRTAGRLGQPGWLLELQLLQLLGKAEAFDNLALDYAVKFEISPPSYVPPKRVALSEDEATGKAAGESAHPVFSLHGVLNMGSSDQFGELRQFAQPLRQVTISLADVPRVDFMAVGMVVDLVMSLAKSGKQVEFIEGNGLVNLLLQMTGSGQFATIRQERRK